MMRSTHWLVASVLMGTGAAMLLAPVYSSSAPLPQALTQLATVSLPTPPPLVRFTGTIHIAETEAPGQHALDIFAAGKRWRFTLSEVKTLTYTTDPDWSILNDIFPRHLYFVGPDHLLRLLQRAEQSGTPVSVRGRLYIGSRMFLLTDVEGPESAASGRKGHESSAH